VFACALQLCATGVKTARIGMIHIHLVKLIFSLSMTSPKYVVVVVTFFSLLITQQPQQRHRQLLTTNLPCLNSGRERRPTFRPPTKPADDVGRQKSFV